jgi:dihydrofolate reductase
MIKIIVAHDHDLAIGKNGEIPWHLNGDFKNFKEVTMGHTVIMGRKIFDFIGKSLPGRRNIVLTRDDDLHFEGVEVCHNYEELLELPEDVFVLGGEQI